MSFVLCQVMLPSSVLCYAINRSLLLCKCCHVAFLQAFLLLQTSVQILSNPVLIWTSSPTALGADAVASNLEASLQWP